MTQWMFQANPKRYDLLKAAATGFSDDWSMNQHRDLVRVGDGIFFLLSGGAAGIYVTGRVVSPVYEAETPSEFGKWQVNVEYEHLVDPPLLRPELLADPVLAGWGPFKGQLRTNFIVPPIVASRVAEVIASRLQPIAKPVGQGFDPTFHEVSTALAAHQVHVRGQMLEFLKTMPPASFEELIRVLLESLGYEEAEVRGRSGDGGVDVAATLRLHGLTAVPTIIQAKRWSKTVPGDIVRQLRGALHVDEHGIVITTGRFTKDAVEEAKAAGKSPIALVDGEHLVDLIIEQGIGVQKKPVALWRLDPEALLSALGGPAGSTGP